jgi:glc operon protein GlcG
VIGQYARAKVAWAHLPDDDTTPPEVKKHINELYAKAGIRDREL